MDSEYFDIGLSEFKTRVEKQISTTPNLDEANTKKKIIEPLLENMGWPISFPEEDARVDLEYRIKMGSTTKKVDYALLIEDEVRVLVEAKSYQNSLRKSQKEQLQSYMRQEGVDWGLLANGSEFEIYKRKYTVRRQDEINVSSFKLEDIEDNSSILSVLSLASIRSGRTKNISREYESAEIALEKLNDKDEKIREHIQEYLEEEIPEFQNISADGSAESDVADAFIESLEEILRDRKKSLLAQSQIEEPEPTPKTREPDTEPPEEDFIDFVYLEDIEHKRDDEVVLVSGEYNSREGEMSGINGFLKNFQSWGTFNFGEGREPAFVGIYVSSPHSKIEYIGRVDEFLDGTEFQERRDVNLSDKFWYSEDEVITTFSEVYKLKEPIPLGEGSAMKFAGTGCYCKFGDLVEAEDISDI